MCGDPFEAGEEGGKARDVLANPNPNPNPMNLAPPLALALVLTLTLTLTLTRGGARRGTCSSLRREPSLLGRPSRATTRR